MISNISNSVVLCLLFLYLNWEGLLKIDLGYAATTQEMCAFDTNQFIESYGFKAEIHDVPTSDGYILKVYRCYNNSFQKGKPVILQHGLAHSSDVFVMNPPNQSLAYFLANRGYDIWLPNSRGNRYSRHYVNSTRDPNVSPGPFWNISWDDMGKFDHPAVIDYVLKKTRYTKLYYVGHSQGTSSLLVLLSLRPQYNKKICVASLLAPVAYENNMGNQTAVYFQTFLLYWMYRNMEYLANTTQQSTGQPGQSMEAVYACRTSGLSLNQAIHYGEIVYFKNFAPFNQNMSFPVFSLTVKPPDFPLSSITADITLHYSLGDPVTHPIDIATLHSKVDSIRYTQVITNTSFAHNDFVVGRTTYQLVYEPMLRFWEKGSCNCNIKRMGSQCSRRESVNSDSN